MRKSNDGLAALVRNDLGGDVVSGGWFVFINRRRTTMKILRFGPGGCRIRAGASSRGCSRFPSALAERRRPIKWIRDYSRDHRAIDAAAELAQPEIDYGKFPADYEDAKRQLDWFRRQLFGSKSEKRVEIPP